MALSPRFQLDDILGNEVVDFQVLQANNDKLDAGAASLTLANTFSNVQTLHRAATTDPALDVRLTGDAPTSPRLRITADGVISWAGGSIGPGAGGTLAINATSVTLGNLKAGAGTAAAPSYSFSSDPDTGLYSPSGDVLGVAVGGVEVNRINNVGEIRFNRTNARIAAGPADDPNTPGERLVRINALEVNPGRLHATGGANISTLQVNSTSVFSAAVTMNSTLNVASTTTVSGTINAYGGRINFEGSNAVYIQWRGDLGALYIPYGNGIYTSHGRFTGNVSVDGALIAGRAIIGGYDPGWSASFRANPITDGRFYQRNNASFYCYDAGDFAYSPSVIGNYLVQRSPEGYIYANYLNTTADIQGGKPTYIAGRAGDNFLRWWPVSSVGAPSLWQARLTANSGQDSASVTLPYSGYYVAFAQAKGGEYSPCWQLTVYMYVGGNTYAENYGSGDRPGHPQWDDSYVKVYMTATYYGAGTTARFHPDCAYNDGNEMWIIFVPSSQYPG
jgi:hypothetical protein